MKKKQVMILTAAILLIGAVGGAGLYYRDEITSAIPFLQGSKSDDKVYVEKISKVMNQYTGDTNRYNGVVESQDTYEVNVDSSRSIKEVYVKVGDTVEEGQELASYDVSEAEMQVKLAQLDREGIVNDITNANKEIETLNAELNQTYEEDERYTMSNEIQSIQNTIAQYQLDLEAKDLEIEKLKSQASDSKVISKKGGIVKSINENGVDGSGESAAFMTILQAGQYRVKGTIDEQNVWMLDEGQQVIIRSRVDESQIWKGTLQKLDTDNVQKSDSDMYSSEGGESATKYPFYIELESVEGLLLGQHVYIELDEGQEEVKDGVWLYASYIVQDESGAYVWTANAKNRLEKRAVELGRYDEELDEYEILSGLAASDYISWPMAGLYEGVTTVTNVDEVDYDSPLYNQESTEQLEFDEEFENFSVDGTEVLYETDMWEEDRGEEFLFPEEEDLFPEDESGTEVEE